jgi:hypothetical protein
MDVRGGTMSRLKRGSFLVAAVWFLVGLAAGEVMADGALPSLSSSDLAQGPFSYMHMLLQKTLLKINVATIEVRVDKATQARLAAVSGGQAYSDALAQQLANVVIAAQRAVVQMQFKRDISLSRWMGVVRENLEQARKAGLVNADLEKKVGQGLPEWFAALKARGYEKGDRLIYAVGPDSLRTVVVAANGQVFVDRLEHEQGTRWVVLASYFAYGSEFREPLLRSLLGTTR